MKENHVWDLYTESQTVKEYCCANWKARSCKDHSNQWPKTCTKGCVTQLYDSLSETCNHWAQNALFASLTCWNKPTGIPRLPVIPLMHPCAIFVHVHVDLHGVGCQQMGSDWPVAYSAQSKKRLEIYFYYHEWNWNCCSKKAIVGANGSLLPTYLIKHLLPAPNAPVMYLHLIKVNFYVQAITFTRLSSRFTSTKHQQVLFFTQMQN